jgi:hypothetical protein
VGFEWDVLGRALASILLVGVVLHAGTLWAFRRLTN